MKIIATKKLDNGYKIVVKERYNSVDSINYGIDIYKIYTKWLKIYLWTDYFQVNVIKKYYIEEEIKQVLDAAMVRINTYIVGKEKRNKTAKQNLSKEGWY